MTAQKGIAAKFKSVWGVGTAIATLGPLGLWAVDLQPPWPGSVGAVATVITASFVVATKVALNPSDRKTKLLGIAGVAAGVTLIFVYLIAYSSLCLSIPRMIKGEQASLRLVIGWTLQPTVQPAPINELLPDYSYDPEQIWTRSSLTAARMIVLVSFCLGFGLLTAGLMALTLSVHGKLGADEASPRKRRGRPAQSDAIS